MTSKENNHRGFVSSLYGTASPGGAVPVAHNSATATMATKGNELLVLDTQAVTVGNDVESQPGVSSASPKTKEEKKEEMFITKSKDDVVCLDAAATPQAAFKKTFSQRYNLTSCWIWTVVFLLGTALVAFVVIAVKPENKESNSNSQDEDIYDRQGYYEDLLGILESPLMQTNSPQGEAIQWMAFNDVPLPLENSNETISRLWQRFALVTSYFANGGPNLWSAFNRKSTAGWIEFGAGVHECDWMGVECNANMQVTGLSLFGEGNGITLTGLLSTELGILTNLEHLDLSTNRLEGKIPDEWKALTNLSECHFKCNVTLFLLNSFLTQRY